ncbi:LytR family transcriptional regulator [Bacillus sp. AFS076308]|uniref:LCP family glycopolymer transferase n=1 Tax=unclassified Bacillus (in: firmicutes) TaxID=185979 RepID=UPI000BF9A165|nr:MULTISPECIES: LCP family protein [unclassified Bacillus (in: firmicutes)]PFO00017.1 LytR family transcriptional regulator [Bacillus sp. AFS076308]PGV51539.1 LytR family transcriptional regulator [Bacillus sp. AFS037270]
MNRTRSTLKQGKRRKVKWFRVTLFFLVILLAGGATYAYSVYHNVAKAVSKMTSPLSRDISAKRETKVKFNNSDPISILMVGVDERKGDSGRTDSMIVVTINPKTKSTKLLSIPRDTRTLLVNNDKPNKQRYDKINAAYAYGGINETIDTVENFLNIPIDYYIKVNMESFKDIVDAVGGINVNNKYAFELDGVSLKKGPQHLNGIEALEYARMRHQDPLGDFGRQQRQQEVISKIVTKGKSFSTLTKYDDILKALEDNIKTNLTLDDMIGIQSTYKPAAEKIESLAMDGEGKILNNGIWYYLVDDETRQELSNQLREQLGLGQETVASIDSYSSN